MPKPKKILFTSHTANFQKFNRPFMRMLKEKGWEVHYASMGEEVIQDADRSFNVPFARNPLKLSNLTAYKKLRKIIENEKYDLIHTHTPVGSVVTRLAARKQRESGAKVIYTAHGFHFFKGAPLLNWLIYYPMEKYMAKYTDTIITINQEDYTTATSSFETVIKYTPGVGVDLTKFNPVNQFQKNKLKADYGFSAEDKLLIYAAELNNNKNQEFLIRSMPIIRLKFPHVKLLLCGKGENYSRYTGLIERLGLKNAVHLMGYRDDIVKLFKASDICVASSIREGLGLNVIEAMATGLPAILSNNRGHRDITAHSRVLQDNMYPLNSENEFTDRVIHLLSDRNVYEQSSSESARVSNIYSLDAAIAKTNAIYRSVELT